MTIETVRAGAAAHEVGATIAASGSGKDLVLGAYLDRLAGAVPVVLTKLSGLLDAESKAMVARGLDAYSALAPEQRHFLVGNPHFCFWWATLREHCRGNDHPKIRAWCWHFHRMLVPALVGSGNCDGIDIALRVDDGLIRFPGFPLCWKIAGREGPEVLHGRLERDGLRLSDGRRLAWSASEQSDIPVRVQNTIADGDVVLDGADPWIVDLLTALSAKSVPEGYPPRDYAPVLEVDNDLVLHFDSAFRLLAQCDPALAAEFRSHTRLVVPYRSEHYSTFTETAYSGAVFLSEAFKSYDQVIHTAEHLLHEHSHYRLALVLEHDALVTDDGRGYYSPWRRVERDLDGMLQAIFVFARISAFLRAAENFGPPELCLNRRADVLADLNAALEILDKNGEALRFTPAGASLFDEIRQEART